MPGPDISKIPLWVHSIVGVETLPAGIEVRCGQMPGWPARKEMFVFRNVGKKDERFGKAFSVPAEEIAALAANGTLAAKLEELVR